MNESGDTAVVRTSVGHHDGDEAAGRNGTAEHAHEAARTDEEANEQRRD